MKKTELVIATTNRGKLREIRKILAGTKYRLIPLFDFRNPPHVKEDGKTFLQNASKKARVTAKFSGKPAVGEDSGLVVESLKGLPGIKSARFAGTGKDEDNIKKLLKMMKNIPWKKRRAHFICTVVLASPTETIKTFTGKCSGFIAYQPRGKKGFGYDPVFYVPAYKKTFAQLSLKTKNSISHRFRAFSKLRTFLKRSNMV